MRICLTLFALLLATETRFSVNATPIGQGATAQWLAEDTKLPTEDFSRVANPKPANPKQRAKWNSAAEEFTAANKSLAEFCKKRGLLEEAQYHTEITKSKPGKSKPRMTTAKARDYLDYWELLRDKFNGVATKWMDYATVAKAGGDNEQYRAGVCQALKTFIDCPAAREARGEAALEGLGWLPQARVDALRLATREGLAPPEDVAAFDTHHAKAGAGFVVLTRHFAICSTARFDQTAKLAAGFDELYQTVAKLLGDAAALGDNRIGVFLYGTQAEFEQANSQREGATWSGGFYRARSGLAHFPLYAQSGALLAANHELTHGVVDYALRGRPATSYDGARGKQSEAAFFGVAEGIAMHLEGFVPGAPEQKLSAIAGRENTLKTLAKECRDLEALFSQTAQTWSEDEADTVRNYAAAAAFTEYCLNAEPAKYGACFMRLLENHYRCALEVSDFERAFGAKRTDFEADFFKWYDGRFK